MENSIAQIRISLRIKSGSMSVFVCWKCMVKWTKWISDWGQIGVVLTGGLVVLWTCLIES